MTFTYKYTVPWGDVDPTDSIYYPNLFHYFEVAIEEFFLSRGLVYREFWKKYGVVLARVSAEGRYHAPIAFDDALDITAGLGRLGEKSVTFHLQVSRGDTRVGSGRVSGVCVDPRRWESVAVPGNLAALCRELGPLEAEPLPEPSGAPRQGPPRALDLRVHAGDTDMAGIAYYPRIFHFFELGVEDLFRHAGFRRGFFAREKNILFPRVAARADFRAPLRAGDPLRLETRVERAGTTSITYGFRLHHGDVPASEGRMTAVALDRATQRPIPLPGELRERVLGEK
ncbi:MAG: acyl-CoA thioesterase [Euryarchaeota archaeon]|nr:acyl-CoA thioesterase [Euryarchaeota archaeon]